MLSKVAIVNKSLTLIGAAPITSLTDDSNNANIMNRVYEGALRSILSECCWPFATKRALLATLDVTLSWYYSGEGYVYQRPTDCIRIFGTNDDEAEWREEGDYIISDTAGLGIRYVYYLDAPSKYSASFIEAFQDKLASDAAFIILNSTSKGEAMLAKYQKVSLPKAMSENSQIGTQQYAKDDAWESAKYSNGAANA